ncbi:Cysteine desulfurase [Brevibacterium ravenspurgense]|uniref:cysteine desulfurase n=2 Tax=Brevibacterium ravenspurgense TaxID=479117 RepID=A0A150HD77_9MICO|nr:Cysteine desulfurase [Brevibacterium ravenspurgense]
MRPTALKAYTDELQKIGNPSALHSLGQQSRLRLEDSREVLAGAVGASTPAEVVLTSGGTEADNLAIKGLFWHRNGVPAEGAGTPTPAPELSHPIIITTPIEHNAVLDTAGWLETQGAQVLLVDVDTDGVIKLDHLEELLRDHGDRTALVSIMYANNEIGTVQPIKEAATLAKAAGVPIHTDAVQAFGQLPLNFADLGVDAMTVTAHKIGGPVGIGALILSRDIKAVPVLHGGGQERSLRSGTLDVAGAAAFAAAAQEATGDIAHEAPRLSGLRDRLIAGIEQGVPDAHLSGHREDRLPGNVHFAFPGAEADSLLFLLDAAGFATSAGSACSAGVNRPSHVLLACGRSEDEARSSQRFTLGHGTTEEEVDKLIEALPGVVEQARKAGMNSAYDWSQAD